MTMHTVINTAKTFDSDDSPQSNLIGTRTITAPSPTYNTIGNRSSKTSNTNPILVNMWTRQRHGRFLLSPVILTDFKEPVRYQPAICDPIENRGKHGDICNRHPRCLCKKSIPPTFPVHFSFLFFVRGFQARLPRGTAAKFMPARGASAPVVWSVLCIFSCKKSKSSWLCRLRLMDCALLGRPT